jgi:DNA-binding HxlR family transcriptional regulator
MDAAAPVLPTLDHSREACANRGACGQTMRDLLDRVGDKWSLMIIGSLDRGPLRFSALQQAIGGISQRMLTLNLRALQRDGLITRTVYPEVPPRVEYALTTLGRSLLASVIGLIDWAKDHSDEVARNRAAHDAAAAEAA